MKNSTNINPEAVETIKRITAEAQEHIAAKQRADELFNAEKTRLEDALPALRTAADEAAAKGDESAYTRAMDQVHYTEARLAKLEHSGTEQLLDHKTALARWRELSDARVAYNRDMMLIILDKLPEIRAIVDAGEKVGEAADNAAALVRAAAVSDSMDLFLINHYGFNEHRLTEFDDFADELKRRTED